MKKFIIMLLLCMFILTSCGKEKSEITVNNQEYKLNDVINVNINLKEEDDNINICPTIKISQDEKITPDDVVKNLNYSLENLELFNYNVKEITETQDDHSWYLKLNLEKMTDDNIVYLSELAKLKLEIKAKGHYNITIDTNNDECFKAVKDNLELEIAK